MAPTAEQKIPLVLPSSFLDTSNVTVPGFVAVDENNVVSVTELDVPALQRWTLRSVS